LRLADLEALQNRISHLESEADNGQQYSRRNSLRVSGVPEEGLHAFPGDMHVSDEAKHKSTFCTEDESYDSGENVSVSPMASTNSTDSKIIDLATSLGINISLTDIDRSHRIGMKNSDKPRDIIVKFTSYRARNIFYRSKIGLKSHGFSGIFVNEDLTRTRSKLFYQARQLVKNNFILSAWTFDGAVIVKDANRKIHRINNVHDLMSVKSDNPIPADNDKPKHK
jgi:exosome complex exonuclease DIS3/RRP44